MRGLPANPTYAEFAGNIITQATAYFANFLGDGEDEGFIEGLVTASVLEGARKAFCDHGIAAPYGPFVDTWFSAPGYGETRDVVIEAPPGFVIDASRGCHDGYDVTSPSQGFWPQLAAYLDFRDDYASFEERLDATSLHVHIEAAEDGCGEDEPPAAIVRYILYIREADAPVTE